MDFSKSFESFKIEYQSLSSNLSLDKIERPDRLHEWLKPQEIEYLYGHFKEKKKLTYDQLRTILDENLDIHFTDIEYNRLFLKINQNRDFKCDWNEFVSYLIFGFQDDDPATQKDVLVLPISTPPIIKKSEHRSAICSISLLKSNSDLIVDDVPESEEDEDDNAEAEPELDDVEEENKRKMANLSVDDTPESTGLWVTASKEGQVRFWTPQLESVRSGTSESMHLKMSTWILCIQALSDVSIVCTSSTERELRFHETVASTFTLRLVMRNLPHAVYCMCYGFHPKGKCNSRLVMGDYGGNVRILEFSPVLRGPFQAKPGAALIEVFWTDILKGKIPLFKVREYINIHSEIIQQTFYSIRLNSLFVAAEYRNTKKYRGRCPGLININGEDKITFRIPLGVTTFCVDERNSIVVTGGPDTFVRIWDVYITKEPSGILSGHNAGIVKIFIQSDENKVYSVDYQKIIKVWDIAERTLLQTYGDLVRFIPNSETDLCYYYHSHLRVLLVAGRKIMALQCNPRIRVDITDGNTHAAPVTVVLYNHLFRNVVTCGLDSYIIVWDPWSGRRKIMLKSCHTMQVYGEKTDIEITAGCFDPLDQYLITGARDGSLKIWNYNNAVCIRNMNIKPEHEVTAVIWVAERILAVGWDQRVTEFNNVEGQEYGEPKKWPMFHTDDITCADVKFGEAVATATYSGELIFWKLETGQPYRKYLVETPNALVELKHPLQDVNDTDEDDDIEDVESCSESSSENSPSSIQLTKYVRKSISQRIRELQMPENQIGERRSTKKDQSRIEAMSTESLQGSHKTQRNNDTSIKALLFLQTRPMTKEHGSILVSLESGYIQVYSHHQHGGFLKQFYAIHKTSDCVLSMACDRKNHYLFTGTAFGYIKIWHIQNYCIPEKEKVKLSMPSLRLQFIFLREEMFLTRAKRSVKYQPEPLLLSSYKGHLSAVNSIEYINRPKILITGGHDFTCRLWTLGGRYLGTLGTPLPWKTLSPFACADENEKYRLPPDIQKVASTTTMKVISGIQTDYYKMNYQSNIEKHDSEETDAAGTDEAMKVIGKPLSEPILGRYFELPGRSATEQHIDLDLTTSYIPVYTHLKIHEAVDLQRPSSPPSLKRLANEDYLDFYQPTKAHNKNAAAAAADHQTVQKHSMGKNPVIFYNDDSEDEDKTSK